MGLEDRFRRLGDLREEMEAEKRERARIWKEEWDRRWNRFAPVVREVCEAFARGVGWEFEGADGRTLTVGLKTPVEGSEKYSHAYLSLTLDPWIAVGWQVENAYQVQNGGQIEVYALLNIPYPVRGYWTDKKASEFAADIGRAAFENLVADALEDRYKCLMQLCIDNHVDTYGHVDI